MASIEENTVCRQDLSQSLASALEKAKKQYRKLRLEIAQKHSLTSEAPDLRNVNQTTLDTLLKPAPLYADL
jgi:hypothetical protein